MIRTILDIKSGKVLPWAAIQTAAYSLLDIPGEFMEEGHQYTLNGIPLESVTGILKDEGFIDDRFFDEFSRTRGKYVHKARHLDDLGELDEDTLDPVIVPYLEAWRAFRRDSGFVVERSEVPMACIIHKYAGTPDCIGRFPAGTLRRAAIELHSDGAYRLIPYTDKQDIAIWLSVLACHRWKLNHGLLK